MHISIVLLQEGDRVIGGAIVHDDEVSVVGGMGEPRGEELLKECTSVPIENEDGDFFVLGESHSGQ